MICHALGVDTAVVIKPLHTRQWPRIVISTFELLTPHCLNPAHRNDV